MNNLFSFCSKFDWNTIVSLVGFVVTVLVVAVQLKKQRELQERQHEANQVLQKNQHRDNIKIEIYHKLGENIQDSFPTGIAMTLHIFYFSLAKAVEKKNEGREYIPPPFELDKINNDFIKVHSNLLRTGALLEKYSIISRQLSLFQKVLSIEVKKLGANYQQIISFLPYLLPSEKGISDVAKLVIPNQEELDSINQKILAFNETAWDVASYLKDIQVEAMNSLLGDFFDNKEPTRVPVEKDMLVLTSEDDQIDAKIEKILKQHQEDEQKLS